MKSQYKLALENTGTDRDGDRKKLLIHLCHDLGEFVLTTKITWSHYDLELLHAQDRSIKVPTAISWKSFANFAYKNQLTLLNWDPIAPIPGVTMKDLKTGFSARILKNMVGPQDCQAGIQASIDGESSEVGVRFVQWTEGIFLQLLSIGAECKVQTEERTLEGINQ